MKGYIKELENKIENQMDIKKKESIEGEKAGNREGEEIRIKLRRIEKK